jgi:hypothetical protein
MAELSNGMFIEMRRVTRVRVSAVDGSTDDAPGTSNTSSKVRASRISIVHLALECSFGSFLFHGAEKMERANWPF